MTRKSLLAISLLYSVVSLVPIESYSSTLVKENIEVIGERSIFVQHFEMEGHKYIYLIQKGHDGLKQVIHDPSCECLKDKKEDKK